MAAEGTSRNTLLGVPHATSLFIDFHTARPVCRSLMFIFRSDPGNLLTLADLVKIRVNSCRHNSTHHFLWLPSS